MTRAHFSSDHRRFFWLETPLEALETHLAPLLGQLGEVSETLLLSDAPLLNLKPISAREAIGYLGRDTERIIVNAFAGFNPNAFAQLCGTLKGGGELILITPPASHWPDYQDPEYAAFRGSRYQDHRFSGYFIRHLITQLSEYRPSPPPLPNPKDLENPLYFSAQQQALVANLLESLAQPASTQVITADRGRGKTSALGLALVAAVEAEIRSKDRPLQVLVTAPNRAAVASLFDMLAQCLPEGRLRGSGFDHPAMQVKFYPPSVLLDKWVKPDLLIVDEAAALPVSLLKVLQRQHTHHWYATTLHGYEGNGRGFELRFLTGLHQQEIPFHRTHLTQPVRWAEGDPLEALCFRMLCLEAEATERSGSFDAQFTYEVLSSSQLIEQTALLNQVFGLLVAAHYRTTPNDLRQLLDSPDSQIRALMCSGQPVAVALLLEEGPLPSDLVEAIWAGYRRPAGDMIPQTLVSREGLTSAAALRGWRVMRIAVHPSMQRKGLGSQLLADIVTEARTTGLDFCGASFAADHERVSFWLNNGFTPFRLGERRDAVTANWPLLVWQPLSALAQALSLEVQHDFYQRLLLKLTLHEQPEEQCLVMRCLAALPLAFTLSESDLAIIQGVALHQRSIDDSLLSLRRGLSLANIMRALLTLPKVDQALLLGRVFRLRSSRELEAITGISGQKAQQLRIRQLLAQLFSTWEGKHDDEFR